MSRDRWGLSSPDIPVEENPGKTWTMKMTRPGIEPGPARWQESMLPVTCFIFNMKYLRKHIIRSQKNKGGSSGDVSEEPVT